MQIANTSTASSLLALQRLFASSTNAGQEMPSAGQSPPSGLPPNGAPPMSGFGGPQAAPDTMSALLSLQTDPDSQASSLISALDKNGDGTLSADEVASAVSKSTSDIQGGFAQLDTNGDGQLSGDELSSAIKQHHGHGHHGHRAEAMAQNMMQAFDSDGDGGLSQSEVANALGQNGADQSALTSAFNGMDANGDGVLSADELASSIRTQMAQAFAAYAANGLDAAA